MIAEATDGSRTLEQCLPQNEQGLSTLTAPTLVVLNKVDLLDSTAALPFEDALPLSVKTGEGLAALRQRIKELAGYHDQQSRSFSARRRHLVALAQAAEALQQGQTQLSGIAAGELLAEDLRRAQRALEEITGAFSSDDLLGRIFSSFCIGK